MNHTREKFAHWLMRWAYRIVERVDRQAVPKVSPWAFTFEPGRGAVINDTGSSSERKGAMLLYLNDHDYERAHNDAGQVPTGRTLEWRGP
jgi:hypothetical protein